MRKSLGFLGTPANGKTFEGHPTCWEVTWQESTLCGIMNPITKYHLVEQASSRMQYLHLFQRTKKAY